MKKILFSLPLILLNLGCMSAQEHQQALHSTAEREMTLGVAQKNIQVGMSQADVATALENLGQAPIYPHFSPKKQHQYIFHALSKTSVATFNLNLSAL
jgi:hypothetical protein